MVQKTTIPLNFSKGLDTKTDPYQVQLGSFLALNNSVFTEAGLLQKRNGYQVLPPLSVSASTLTTFKGNPIAAGSSLSALLRGDTSWFDRGVMQPVRLSTTPLVRSSASQQTSDSAVSTSSGLLAVTWQDNLGVTYYQVQDTVSGQLAVGPVALPTGAKHPRVFLLNNSFVVTFLVNTTHLQYIAIPVLNPANPSAATDLSTQVHDVNAAYDGVVANNNLYLAFNASDIGGAIRQTYLTSTLTQGGVVVFASSSATFISLTADLSGSTPVIWTSFYDGTSIFAYATSPILVTLLALTTVVTAANIDGITSLASGMMLTILYQTLHTYSYDSQRSDFVSKVTVTEAGTVGTPSVVLRGVALASKAYATTSGSYVTVVYGTGPGQTGSAIAGALQPTYLVSDFSGNLVAKFAYSNAGGYPNSYLLPSVSVQGNLAQFSYLYKDIVEAVNPSFLTPPSSTGNIYAQTGINLINLDFSTQPFSNVEIGANLLLGGGFLWAYDGQKPVEQNFHLFPEDLFIATATTGGFLTAQQYFYQGIYEWTDAQGNIHRSAPSIPVTITTTGSTSVNTVNIPTLRLTYKTGVRLTLYRWSTAQQNYYQITSISSPLLNDPTVDSVTFTDTLADSSILGNNLVYTTGGVIEDTGAPSTSVISLFKSRLFMVDAEDSNLLWYSKQVIEAVPVEMSDLLTLYVSPTTGAQGSTGNVTALFPMDDKLIVFKPDAIYYITGTGPDNTGAQNDFSDPVFITSIVGCANPQSLVMTGIGLMFQSDKGIWLLGRDLSTSYIGAPVEAYNSYTVTSATAIPDTNQVRFTLNADITLMYDYYYGQWGTFGLYQGISSTLYQGLHTFLTPSGTIYQENPGSYLDGSSPVLLNFSTSWISLAGLQGYQRTYFFELLATYQSPHFLNVQIAYDYAPSSSQQLIISPTNYSGAYGSDALYGQSTPYGGAAKLEQWKVQMQRQRCMAFQINITEVANTFFGQQGSGFTMSGLNLQVGIKRGSKPLGASQATG